MLEGRAILAGIAGAGGAAGGVEGAGGFLNLEAAHCAAFGIAARAAAHAAGAAAANGRASVTADSSNFFF